jgi:O-antigen ligase
MLRDVRFINGYYIGAVYSHCNYTEIAADFGIVGLVIWYVPVLGVFIASFLRRKENPMIKMAFILLCSMVVLDYARIPWANHISTYVYFNLILLYFYSVNKVNPRTRGNVKPYEQHDTSNQTEE